MLNYVMSIALALSWYELSVLFRVALCRKEEKPESPPPEEPESPPPEEPESPPPNPKKAVWFPWYVGLRAKIRAKDPATLKYWFLSKFYI